MRNGAIFTDRLLTRRSPSGEFVQLIVGERLCGWPNKEILLDRPNFGDLVKSDEPADGFEIQIFQGRHVDVCEQAADGKRDLLCILGEAAFEGELFKTAMSDTDQKLEDEVLRRMLATPPKPHKPLDGKSRKDSKTPAAPRD